jgi:RNA polymerase sigma factor (sigma-70 family)
MAAGSDILLRYIRHLGTAPQSDAASDAALLGRYVSAKDQAAFATLVDRHGALVFHVCRRILVNVQDAEDAFQAVFFVLARKAATVRPRETLSAWLHGVAYRVALKARSTRARKLRAARPIAPSAANAGHDPLAELSARELLTIVDDEVRRLPQVYRLPVILCCLEGHSQEEAARQLGWTAGSVKGRLERGRAQLHKRLSRRGLALPAALAAVEVSRSATSAAAIGGLFIATVQGAMAFAARGGAAANGVSKAGAAVLAEGVLKSMAVAKTKFVAMLLLAAGVAATGTMAFGLANTTPMNLSETEYRTSISKEKLEAVSRPVRAEKPTVAPGNDDDTPTQLRGQVLGPDGKPFAGARLYMGYAPRRWEPDAVLHQPAYPPRTISGADGGFNFTFTRSELDERFLDASRPIVIAMADGWGMDWTEIGNPAALSLRLVEDLPLEGRILNADRKPVAGAKISVQDVSSDSAAGLTRLLQDGTPLSGPLHKGCRGPLPGQPQEIVTDADGGFRLAGIARDRVVTLTLYGPQVQRVNFRAVTRPSTTTSFYGGIRGSKFVYGASSSRTIRGVVRDKVTRRPMAGVKVSVSDQGTYFPTFTDAAGGYELSGCPKSPQYLVAAQPQHGEPYFAASASLSSGVGLDSMTADFDLLRGIPLKGRVIDQSAGKPPKRAVVEYYSLYPNPHASLLTKLAHLVPASSAAIASDGSFSLAVLPGPGIVLVAASPRDSYATALLDNGELANLFGDMLYHGGGSWFLVTAGDAMHQRCVNRYNALSLIKPDVSAKLLELDFSVRPARGLKGTLIGPDGEPVVGALVCGLTSMPDPETLTSESFTVEGLNPRCTRELSFHHVEKGLGKVLTIRGDEPEPLTVRLEPCGVVVGRLLDRANKPKQGQPVCFSHYDFWLGVNVETDEEGRFRAALVPGLTYDFYFPRLDGPQRRDRRAAPVEPGQTTDLGDLVFGD